MVPIIQDLSQESPVVLLPTPHKSKPRRPLRISTSGAGKILLTECSIETILGEHVGESKQVFRSLNYLSWRFIPVYERPEMLSHTHTLHSLPISNSLRVL